MRDSTHSLSHLPGLSMPLPVGQVTGRSHGVFYWYVPAEKKPETAPLIIWTSGGPGTSSLYGLLVENGPYRCHVGQNHSIHFTHVSGNANWSSFANYLVLDHPLGVGFSFSSMNREPLTPKQGAKQLVAALEGLKRAHPVWFRHPIILAGESYGASIIADSLAVLKDKELSQSIRGVVLISGWVDPARQLATLARAAYHRSLISSDERKTLSKTIQECVSAIREKSSKTEWLCEAVDTHLQTLLGSIPMHDIQDRSQSSVRWDQADWIRCLNDSETRADLGIYSDRRYFPSAPIWKRYGQHTFDSTLMIYKQWLRNPRHRMLVFTGDSDMSSCGYAGTRAWLKAIYPNSEWHASPWTADGHLLGQQGQIGSIHWVRVLNAGHTIPTRQPKIAHLIIHFLHARIPVKGP